MAEAMLRENYTTGVENTATKVLKRGDLVRINSTRTTKLKDLSGDLGRVTRATPVGPTLENSHPFVYDLDLVLGGKLNGAFRADLLYTTASNEGMVGDSRESRKRRKPEPVETTNAVVPTKVPKKKNKTGPQKKKTATERAKSNTKKASKVSKGKTTEDKPTVIGTNSQGVDLYERHRREFERSLGRLEKIDAYNFFGSEVPPEFQEDYFPSDKVGVDVQEEGNSTTTDGNVAPASIGSTQVEEKEMTPVHMDTDDSDKAGVEKSQTQSQNQGVGPQFPSHAPYNFVIIRQRMDHGRYTLDRARLENEERVKLLVPYFKAVGKKNYRRIPKKSLIPVLHPKGIDWNLFKQDVESMCDAALERNAEESARGPGSLHHAAERIKEQLHSIFEKIGLKHLNEIATANDRHRFGLALDKSPNSEAAMQSKWKQDAFPERKYTRLREDAVCAGLSEVDKRIATYELRTTLPDSFVGLAYTYDDTGQSEGWMKSFLGASEKSSERQKAALAMSIDDGVIKAQVAASMQTLLIAVQDRVMTEMGVLEQRELKSANWEAEAMGVEHVTSDVLEGVESHPEIVEQPVWGIDCYTRRNVTICLETEFSSDIVLTFIEKWLLPAINACPEDMAYNLANAARMLEGLPLDLSTSLRGEGSTTHEQWEATFLGRGLMKKISSVGPPWLRAAANLLRRATECLGPDFFRVHPKGHGSIVLCEKLEPNRLVTFYRGEVYPSWRWGEKTDAISIVQEKKGLKPVLPDFFNMALERPQNDPRGYGLLFVDASRKSGYGSMLSHSCQPSCEVRVVAVNGELRLAMTTLREMTIGDELTFDYNAVTESLIEFQSAVCLCGHGHCRGSFLHFATADCYQQVLNRNSPIAVRFANLIKGSTKQIMSEDDDNILKRHGFQTASFGAVSVNRRKAQATTGLSSSLDSMDIVPVWLRTYVADTLRYIEYERRALPIALICNDLAEVEPSDSVEDAVPRSTARIEEDTVNGGSDEDDKPVKGSRPEPTFLYFSRKQREYFVSLLAEDVDKKELAGMELKREIQKLASTYWNSLDSAAKESWKEKAFEDWEKAGGREKAKLEEQRQKRVSKGSKAPSKGVKSKKSAKAGNKENVDKTPKQPQKISFQQADAEGVSAMEQRIQQLTQTLSRIGRVLDRHRETCLTGRQDRVDNVEESDKSLRDSIHSPLNVMPDQHVVAWMWNHDEGIVRQLQKYLHSDSCASPDLRASVDKTIEEYKDLEKFGFPWDDTKARLEVSISPFEGRQRLNSALLQLRQNLLDGINQMASAIKKHRAAVKKEAARRKKLVHSVDDNDSRHSEIRKLLDEMVGVVEVRLGGGSPRTDTDITSHEGSKEDSELDPWLQHFNKRFKIEKAADLLLIYAQTGNFFSVKPYAPLRSSPIEVYARELGNSVPVSVVDEEEQCGNCEAISPGVCSTGLDSPSAASHETAHGSKHSRKGKNRFCNPEDIISNVAIDYQGDYVISQLLQWYNAGVGQKPGLPDLLGCIMLPTMKGCWKVDGTTVTNSYTERATSYQSSIRRRLIEWFTDSTKRGNPWPDDIRKAFVDKEDDVVVPDASKQWLPLGSPILDFLVTGDDSGVNKVVRTLSSFYTTSATQNGGTSNGLLSSVDEGRPAQAVSNWVQCENPDCQKWRKVPWNVDIDMLSEKFVCTDNVWNPASASCDAPEDEWDEAADAQVLADGSAVAIEVPEPSEEFPSADDLRLGARFDVLHEDNVTWFVGTVVKVDFTAGTDRVMIQRANSNAKSDEWVEVGSGRLAPLYSKVSNPENAKESLVSSAGVKKRPPKKKPTASKRKVIPQRAKSASSTTKPTVISDEASADNGESSISLNAVDSSMAGVFVHESDGESTDKSRGSNGVSALQDTDSEEDVEKETKPHGEVSEKPAPTPDETAHEAEDAPAPVFTIPKKKTSVPEPKVTKFTRESTPPPSQGNRIPRKGVSVPNEQTGSLLLGHISQGPVEKSTDKMTRENGIVVGDKRNSGIVRSRDKFHRNLPNGGRNEPSPRAPSNPSAMTREGPHNEQPSLSRHSGSPGKGVPSSWSSNPGTVEKGHCSSQQHRDRREIMQPRYDRPHTSPNAGSSFRDMERQDHSPAPVHRTSEKSMSWRYQDDSPGGGYSSYSYREQSYNDRGRYDEREYERDRDRDSRYDDRYAERYDRSYRRGDDRYSDYYGDQFELHRPSRYGNGGGYGCSDGAGYYTASQDYGFDDSRYSSRDRYRDDDLRRRYDEHDYQYDYEERHSYRRRSRDRSRERSRSIKRDRDSGRRGRREQSYADERPSRRARSRSESGDRYGNSYSPATNGGDREFAIRSPAGTTPRRNRWGAPRSDPNQLQQNGHHASNFPHDDDPSNREEGELGGGVVVP
eukprot:Nitzschia sp. Nitz4//scaffold41_size133979//27876//35172//NITZ4_003333-RA/size133979-snap-gene-0.98-mRNA-1//1//CDS//3329551428//6908//frame0